MKTKKMLSINLASSKTEILPTKESWLCGKGIILMMSGKVPRASSAAALKVNMTRLYQAFLTLNAKRASLAMATLKSVTISSLILKENSKLYKKMLSFR